MKPVANAKGGSRMALSMKEVNVAIGYTKPTDLPAEDFRHTKLESGLAEVNVERWNISSESRT